MQGLEAKNQELEEKLKANDLQNSTLKQVISRIEGEISHIEEHENDSE